MMTKEKKYSILFSFLLFGGIFFLSSVSYAAGPYDYTSLESIPGTGNVGSNLADYLQAIYKFAIWTVGIAAILMITIGGFMYLVSAGNTSKMDVAKRVVTDAVIGLIVVLSAYLLLYVINPDLVKISIVLKPLGSGTSTPSIPPTQECKDACKDKKKDDVCSCNGSGKCDVDGGTCKVVDACTAACASPKAEGADCSCNSSSGKCKSEKCEVDTGKGCSAIAAAAGVMVNSKTCFYSQPKRSDGCLSNPGYTDCSKLAGDSFTKAGCRKPGNVSGDFYSAGESFSGSSTLKAGDAIATTSPTKHVVICASDGCATVYHASGASSTPNLKESRGASYIGNSNAKVVRASKYCDSCGN